MNSWSKWFIIGRRITIASALASVVMIIAVASFILWKRYELSGERIDSDAKATLKVIAAATSALVWNFDTNAMKAVQSKSKSDLIEGIYFFDQNDKPLTDFPEVTAAHQIYSVSEDILDAGGKKVGRVELKYNHLEKQKEFLRDVWRLGIAFGILLVLQLVSSGGIWWANQKIISSLVALVNRVKASATTSIEKSGSVRRSADGIRDVAREQSAATEQTVAAIAEIRSTMGKTQENVEDSTEKVLASSRLAENGKASVSQMVEAVNEISVSNEQMFEEMEQTNEQLHEIVKVINEISNRTKVINEIVFQTKLLSFNASVEAARAGEHGKGFAVVAEEVGNLAKMSGSASTDIERLLRESVSKTESIVAATTEGLARSVARSKEKAESGVRVAQECGSLFDRLADNISNLESAMIQVRTASGEQHKAIEDIYQAATMIQDATERSVQNANAAAESAENLAEESQQLASISDELQNALGGEKKKAAPSGAAHESESDYREAA